MATKKAEEKTTVPTTSTPAVDNSVRTMMIVFTVFIIGIFLLSWSIMFVSNQRNTTGPTVAPQYVVVTATPSEPSGNTPVLTQTACTEAKLLRSWTHEVENDQAAGDSFNWWITASWDGNDARTWFVALGEPMFSLDFQKPVIVSAFYLVEAKDLAAASCVADEVVKSVGSGPYKLFVGTAEPPSGWSKTPLSGWSMRISQYTETPIDPGGQWTEVAIKRNSDRRTYSAVGGYLYLQLWNPNVPNKATHVIVAPNWKVTIPLSYQGTGWLNIDGEQTLLLQRFAQATAEVFLRDKKPVITKLWCGPSGGPMGWDPTMPNGWSCATS